MENEWEETDDKKKIGRDASDQARTITRSLAAFERKPVKTWSPVRRRHSKSPYKPQRDEGTNALPLPPGRRIISPLSSRPGSDIRNNNVSPFTKSERKRQVSPFKFTTGSDGIGNDEIAGLVRKQVHRVAVDDSSRQTEKTTNYSNRSASAPRPRLRDKDQQIKYDHGEQKIRGRTQSLLWKNSSLNEKEVFHKNSPSVGKVNELMAKNSKISRGLVDDGPIQESTDSISPGDIFFSRDYGAVTMQKIILPKNGGFESNLSPKSNRFAEKPHGSHKLSNGSSDVNVLGNSTTTFLTRNSMVTSSGVSRRTSNASDGSDMTSGSARKFAANRRKSQTEAWFSCIRNGYCRTSKRSPERERAFDEASFIEKAFVVESLRQFWADKHQPASLNGFTCHKQEAQLLKHLASHEICPHILLKGPPGSGKKALTMAYLREIYGDSAWNISHDSRKFQVQETSSTQLVVPVTSSAHHVELNVHLEPDANYALMALMKQISSKHSVIPEISNMNFKANYTVMVLYDVDKAAEKIQHLIKWIMDCYTDVCKLVLCCQDDLGILESVKTRCKVIKVDAPVTHEIMEVLIQIARKENFDISMSFAAKIATKAKQNLRKAIMALEACKAHNYPFVDDQPIPLGWEEIAMEIALEILADPSTNRLYLIRGKLQRLLLDFVHPKLILQKLVEQFLKRVDASLKRELYYWHNYYEKRLPTGTSALLKLEEFSAKFMGMYKKISSNRHKLQQFA